jgi:hypothetical protein
VAEVVGNTLTLNLGKKAGVRVGEQLTILRDPPAAAESANPQGMAPLPERIGNATVREVGDDYSTATFSGSGEAKVGDQVRSIEQPGATLR